MRRLTIFGVVFCLINSCTSYKIQRIKFESTNCKCPIFSIAIDENKLATYIASNFNGDANGHNVTGTFKTKIDNIRYQEIEELLEEIDFANLKDKYSVDETDQPTAILTITYNNGQIKVIEDYGEQGTLGLKHLYQLLFNLGFNQNWH